MNEKILFILIPFLISILISLFLAKSFFKAETKGFKKKKKKKKKSKKKRKKFNIKNEIKKLEKGYLNFNCPKRVEIEENFKVKVLIGNKKDFFSNISNKIEEIETGELMKLSLKGNNFEIQSLNNESQYTLDNELREWEWNVKAKKRGEQNLKLLISIQFQSPKSGVGYIDYPIMEKKIIVRVSFSYRITKFLKKYWNWIIGFIFGSGIIWKIIEHFNN